MGAIELRLKKLEGVTFNQKGVACLLRQDNETDEACIARYGYQGRPASAFVVITETDARL